MVPYLPPEVWSIILNVNRKRRFKTVKERFTFPFRPTLLISDNDGGYFIHKLRFCRDDILYPVLTVIIGYSMYHPEPTLNNFPNHFVIVKSRFAPVTINVSVILDNGKVSEPAPEHQEELAAFLF